MDLRPLPVHQKEEYAMLHNYYRFLTLQKSSRFSYSFKSALGIPITFVTASTRTSSNSSFNRLSSASNASHHTSFTSLHSLSSHPGRI